MTTPGLAQKTLRVLRAVISLPGGAGLSELARESGVPKATCHRVLSVLKEEGWIQEIEDRRRYIVSLEMQLALGRQLQGTSFYQHVQQILGQLTKDVQETAGLDQLAGTVVIVTTQVQGPHLITSGMRPVPRHLPAWRTSTGRVLLAWKNDEKLNQQIESEIVRERARVTSFADLRQELQKVRAEGYAVAYDELEEGAAAIAVPVVLGGQAPYAMWVGGPKYRLPRERIPELTDHLTRAARQLAEVLEIHSITPESSGDQPRAATE